MMSNKPVADHEKRICNMLDQRVDALDLTTQKQLAEARMHAISVNSEQKPVSIWFQLKYVSVFAFALVTGTILLHHGAVDDQISVAAIPVSMIKATASLPSEDIAMLADIEFVQWLANNEYEL